MPSTNMADVQVTKGCVVTRISLPVRFYGRLGRPTKANRYLVETCWGQVWVSGFVLEIVVGVGGATIV